MNIFNKIKSCSDELNVVEVVEPINRQIRPESVVSEKNTRWILNIATRGVSKKGHVIAIRDSASNSIINYRYADNNWTEELIIQLFLDTIELYGKPANILNSAALRLSFLMLIPNRLMMKERSGIVIILNGNNNSRSFNDDGAQRNCFGITTNSSATLPEWESLSFAKRSEIPLRSIIS